jgi:hypothetical protein
MKHAQIKVVRWWAEPMLLATHAAPCRLRPAWWENARVFKALRGHSGR